MDLFDKLDVYSSNIAIIDENLKAHTYKNLLVSADKLGKNIKKRKTIFLICKNSYEFIFSYVGLIRAKAVIFLINHSISKKKLEYLIYHYKPKYILNPIEKNLPNIKLKKVLCLNKKYKLFKTNFKVKYALHDDLAILMTTSGSTGSPKFVKLSYLNLFDNAKNIAKYLNIQSSDRPITTMQPSYSYGLSIINSHLMKGSSIITTEASMFEKRFWQLFKKNKATTFGGVPYTYEILKKLKFQKMTLPHLNYITQAGGKLNDNLLNEFIEMSKIKKIKFYVMYGQTEASPRMSYLDWKYVKKKIGSIGKPIPGGKFYIYNDKNKIIKKNNAVGELIYEGNNVMLGYAEKIEDLKKENFNKNKLFTGDFAKRDKDGFYYITGRKNRYLKMFGLRINLDEVEQQIKSQNIDSACLGKDDNLKVLITNSQKKSFVTNFLTQNLGINKSHLSISIVKKIPKNLDGKILYSNLQNLIT